MRTRALLILIVAALLATLAAAWIASLGAPETEAGSDLLAPQLAKTLPAVSQVRITGAGDAVLATLARTDDGSWVVRERWDHPADTGHLRELLSTLSHARRIEAKTALPERYAQLGVEDLAVADARGVGVEVEAPDQALAWVIGDQLPRGTGTYVRASGEAQSWLVNARIDVERDVTHWLDRQLLDIGSDQVRAVTITDADGTAFGVERDDQNVASDFRLLGTPAGREAAREYQRDALASVLSVLNMEDVRLRDEVEEPGAVHQARFELLDGRVVEIRSWQDEAGSRVLAHLSMSSLPAGGTEIAAAESAAGDVAAGDDTGDPAAAADGDDLPAAAEPRAAEEQAAAFNQAHGRWVYVLPSFKAGNLRRPLDDYLAPLED